MRVGRSMIPVYCVADSTQRVVMESRKVLSRICPGGGLEISQEPRRPGDFPDESATRAVMHSSFGEQGRELPHGANAAGV